LLYVIPFFIADSQNMHELACVSGLAVAYRLGAEYPFPDDEFASTFFKMYLLLSHGTRYKRRP